MTTNNHITTWLPSIDSSPCCHQKECSLRFISLQLHSAINIIHVATQTGCWNSFSWKLTLGEEERRKKKNISFQSDEHLNLSAFLNTDASTKEKRVTCREMQGRSTATLLECSALFLRKVIVHFTLGTLRLIYFSCPSIKSLLEKESSHKNKPVFTCIALTEGK